MEHALEELKEAARAYSQALDAWNATAQAPLPERNWRSAAAFDQVKKAKEKLTLEARVWALMEAEVPDAQA